MGGHNKVMSETCIVCKCTIEHSFLPRANPLMCWQCGYQIPASLVKAHTTPFSYVLRLRTGEFILFESAKIAGLFAHLENVTVYKTIMSKNPLFLLEGTDVRISDVVWCAEAPEAKQ